MTLAVRTAWADPPEEELADLSIEELLEVPITTASNIEEKLVEAPAAAVVLSSEEIDARGYHELGDIFDDLPGMDVIRSYGDNWILVYWRGYRVDVAAPFLLMVDGLTTNSLYFVDVDVPLTTLPLTAIDKVEIVQGPASSVFGPNAFMGAVNVLTLQDLPEDGVRQKARLAIGTDGARTADATFFYKRDTLRFRVSARFDTGLLDDSTNEEYEYTKDAYYASPELWGGFIKNPNLGGKFRSAHRSRALDAHLYLDRTEVAARWMSFASGYGMEYAADKVQNNAVWARSELDTYVRHHATLGEGVETRSVLRYRESGIPGESYFVDGYEDPALGRVAAFSYWQSHNYSWSAYQDVFVEPRGGFSLTAGLKLEQKDLQKAYDINGESAPGTPGGYEPVATISPDTYDFPDPPRPVREAHNRIQTEDLGVYAQMRYDLSEAHHLHLGGRIDANSGYDVEPTVRAGYVGRIGAFGIKALYGQAFTEPPARVLYGGWTGSGSDPDLSPERSQTFELNLSHSFEHASQGLSAYVVRNTDTIQVGAEPRNLGTRDVVGLDWTFRVLVPQPALRRLELWGSYTHLFQAEEQVADDDSTDATTTYRIGDLADDKLHFGLWAVWDRHVEGTIRGRWIGPRPTVFSNPVREVRGFATLDASVRYRDFLATGVGLSLDVQNLFDAQYKHPGLNEASAGVETGGSKGYFSSLMPQPGTTAMLSLWIER